MAKKFDGEMDEFHEELVACNDALRDQLDGVLIDLDEVVGLLEDIDNHGLSTELKEELKKVLSKFRA